MSMAAKLSPRRARHLSRGVVAASIAIVACCVTWAVVFPPPQVKGPDVIPTAPRIDAAPAEANLSRLRPLWQLPLRRPLGEVAQAAPIENPATPAVAPPAVRVVGLVGDVALIEHAGQVFSLRVGETRDGVGTLSAVERGRIVLSYRGDRVTLDLPYDAAPDRLISTP